MEHVAETVNHCNTCFLCCDDEEKRVSWEDYFVLAALTTQRENTSCSNNISEFSMRHTLQKSLYLNN